MSASWVVRRASLRAALTAVVQHAGKASKDFPYLGRVRWTLDPSEPVLLVWAGDLTTCAVARVRVEDLDGVPAGTLEQWDTTVGVVGKILAVFRASSTRESDDDDLSLELTGQQLHLTETGALLPGEHLKVPRISIPAPEEDNVPDVPKLLAPYAEAPRSTFGIAAVSTRDLVKFAPSVKAYGGTLEVAIVDDPYPRLVVGAQGEPDFLGLAYRLDHRGDDARTDDELASADKARMDWAVQLEPLRRPDPVKVPASLEEAVLEDLRSAFAEHGDRVHLSVMRDVDDPDEGEPWES